MCFCVLFFLPPVSAASQPVLIFLDLQSKYSNEIIQKFTESKSEILDAQFVYDSHQYDTVKKNISSPGAIVATSLKSCNYILSSSNSFKENIFCLFIQSAEYESLVLKYPNTRFHVISIDQPPNRQITITRNVFPQIQRFGILGNANSNSSKYSNKANQIRQTNSHESISKQIRSLLKNNDAIVAVPDRYLYTKENIRTILFTAYATGKPIIGYSPGYVKAGALLTAYSTPSQLVAHFLELYFNNKGTSKSNDSVLLFAKYFSVAINASVAESLSLFSKRAIESGKSYEDRDFE